MPKFRITKTIIQDVVIEVEEKDLETAKKKVDNWDYDDLFYDVEVGESSERDSEYKIEEVKE